jgi:WD40 repeat protein
VPIRGLACTPEGKRLASAHENGTVQVWDVAAGKSLQKLVVDQPMNCVAFGLEGGMLAAGGAKGRIALWLSKPQGYELVWQTHAPKGDIHGVAISPDGQWVVCVNKTGYIHFLDTNSGKVRRSLIEFGNGLSGGAYLPDGKTLVTGGQDFRTWDIASANLSTKGQEKENLTLAELEQRVKKAQRLHNLGGWTACLAVAPDGKWAVTGGVYDRTDKGFARSVMVIDLDKGKVSRHLGRMPGDVASVTISSDGKHIAAIAAGGLLHVWDAATSQIEATYTVKGEEISALVFLPKTDKLALGGESGTVKIWSLKDRTEPVRLR